MADEQLIPEQKRARNVKNTLESKLIQEAVGGNEVKSNPYLYGQLGLNGGEAIYEQVMSSDEAKELKDGMYDEREKERKALNIADKAPYPVSYDVMVKLAKQLQEVQSIAKLSELEKYAKAVGAELDFELPEQLQNYSYMEIVQKALGEDGKFDEGRLNDEEKDALQIHGILSKAYERAVALKAAQSNYFDDFNGAGNKILEKYKPVEDNSAE